MASWSRGSITAGKAAGRLYRMDDDTWEGMDDKAGIIRLVHVRSRARHGHKWTYSKPL